MSNDIYFSCRPVRASEVNPDGSPALIDECPLAEAQWIGIYRHNPDHEATDENPSEWVLDLDAGHSWLSREHTNRVARGLCDLLNGISAQDALSNPNLHIFFE